MGHPRSEQGELAAGCSWDDGPPPPDSPGQDQTRLALQHIVETPRTGVEAGAEHHHLANGDRALPRQGPLDFLVKPPDASGDIGDLVLAALAVRRGGWVGL